MGLGHGLRSLVLPLLLASTGCVAPSVAFEVVEKHCEVVSSQGPLIVMDQAFAIKEEIAREGLARCQKDGGDCVVAQVALSSAQASRQANELEIRRAFNGRCLSSINSIYPE